MQTRMKLGLGSVAVALAVLALKSAAFAITGSVALLSDALESSVNVVAALAALAAIRIAAQPADARHPYGHDKAEFLSAVLEGVMIIVAALLILREAYRGLAAPGGLDAPWGGLAVSLAATIANAAWSRVLTARGRAERSPALVADGRHLAADVATSLGVVAGVALAVATGWWWLDPALAGLVALYILWSGWDVVRGSLSGLMDEAVPEEMLATVTEVIAAEGGGALQAHDLRTRHAGQALFIDFHLVVPGETTVHRAHEICDRIESGIEARLGAAIITIHVEPEHKAKSAGAVVFE